MAEETETVEDIAAGILNGVMVCLLSAAFPVLLGWQAVVQRETWDFRSIPMQDSLSGVVLLLLSFQFLTVGFRSVRKNISALRRRGSSLPTD
ncbi:MAG: hypothetical protein RL093_1288 [Pseudomonadota bacterium]|jgi:hypothetical protein